MTLEQLIALGVAADVAEKVVALHKQSLDGNYIPKATFEAERDKVKDLDKQVKERDTQITELGKFKGTAEELQTKVETLEKANKTTTDDYNAKVSQMEKNYTIKSAIADSVIDSDDVLPKLDQSLIVFKEGKIVSGLTEQIDSLKKAKPHYFKTETEGKKPTGFNFFGTTPAEGQVQGTDGAAGGAKPNADFGKQLAQARVGGTGGTKATNPYFQ